MQTRLSILAAALLVCPPAATLAQAPLPSNATVYVSGLEGPRGLAFAPDGTLYVAEGGLGGATSTVGSCRQVPAPVGPYKGGLTARISKVDSNGTRTTLTSGLPSALDGQGNIIGTAGLAFLNGNLYALLAGGGCSHGNSNSPNAVIQVNLQNGQSTQIANLSQYITQNPGQYTNAGDYEPDGSWYGLIAYRGFLLAIEANHGQIVGIAPGGGVLDLLDLSSSNGHIVPTSIVATNTNLYVGNFTPAPFIPEAARVLTVSLEAFLYDPLPGFTLPSFGLGSLRVAGSKAGFTTITGMALGPDGLLYVLELATGGGITPGTGKVVRVNRSGGIDDVVTGLTVPTGLTFGPDGALYVSNLGAAPGPAGQILRVSVTPAQ